MPMRSMAIHFIIFTVGIALSFSAVGGSQKRPPLKETQLYTEMTTDCQRVNLKSWTHPTKSVVLKREGVTLDWVELCNQNKYPIFGVHFKYDPQGVTKNYFIPLYLDTLKANGNWPLSFVILSDDTIINLNSKGKKEISERYEYFSQ